MLPGVRIGKDRLFPATLDRFAAALAWKFGWFEARERRFIMNTVVEGMTAVDVGANIGLHTLILARCVAERGRIYAIEAEPQNFRSLEKALAAASLPHVTIYQAAAGEDATPKTLFLSRWNSGDHRMSPSSPSDHEGGSEECATRRGRGSAAGGTRSAFQRANDGKAHIAVAGVVLDELLDGAEHVDFVKIDVQGAEAAVLRGMVRTLCSNPDICVLVELCPDLLQQSGTSSEAFFAPLGEAGLQAHYLDHEARTVPIEESRAWDLAEATGYVNLVFKRG